MLHKNTFGNSACAENLVKILNEMNDEKITTNISRFLVSNNKIIHELAKIKDNDVQKTLANLFRASLYNTELKVPSKVKTHAINILIARLRDNVIRV